MGRPWYSQMVWLGLVTLAPMGLVDTARAQDSSMAIKQLLSTRACPGCTLSQAGLVFAELEGVDLQKADLSQANLSRASLKGAKLQQANLVGAVLYGANLQGADLQGADLRGADLRGAFLGNANLQGAQLQGANLRGAIALPRGLINAREYYGWGLSVAEQGRHQEAIEYYTQAIRQDPGLAIAYLARGVSQSSIFNPEGAIADLKQAETLFQQQKSTEGVKTVQDVLLALQQAQDGKLNGPGQSAPSSGGGSSGVGNALGNLFQSVLGLALQFLL